MAEKDRRFRKSETAILSAFIDLRARGTVTVTDVIRAADVSKATFYLHYPSMKELVNAALDLLLFRLATFMGEEETMDRLIKGIGQESRLARSLLLENASSLADGLLVSFPGVFMRNVDDGASLPMQKRQARCCSYAFVGYLISSFASRQKPSYEGWSSTMSGLRF